MKLPKRRQRVKSCLKTCKRGRWKCGFEGGERNKGGGRGTTRECLETKLDAVKEMILRRKREGGKLVIWLGYSYSYSYSPTR